MKFRHNEVLGFGKFLVDVKRLIFFFLLKEKILRNCLLCHDSSAVEIPVKECVGKAVSLYAEESVPMYTHSSVYLI